MTSIKGLDDLQRKFKTLENFQRALKKPMTESVALVHDYISTAPRKKKGAFSAMATPGQKRAYWYLVKKGKIEHGKHGYKRTLTMSKGWTHKVTPVQSGVKGEVGNVKAGDAGQYVQGSRQQPFHKASGWRTVDQTIEATQDKVFGKFEDAAKKELSK